MYLLISEVLPILQIIWYMILIKTWMCKNKLSGSYEIYHVLKFSLYSSFWIFWRYDFIQVINLTSFWIWSLIKEKSFSKIYFRRRVMYNYYFLCIKFSRGHLPLLYWIKLTGNTRVSKCIFGVLLGRPSVMKYNIHLFVHL